jgi:hypothetical protein
MKEFWPELQRASSRGDHHDPTPSNETDSVPAPSRLHLNQLFWRSQTQPFRVVAGGVALFML